MKFLLASEVEQVCWEMKQADYPRGRNRQRINELFNGHPPFTPQEEEENGIEVNVNFLESTRLGHDARSQFYNAFLKPGSFFTLRTDSGPKHKRLERGITVSRKMNQIMKRSLIYYEAFRSKFALNVLHGIGPTIWRDDYSWCPRAAGVEDMLIPSTTLLTMENLPFFSLYHSFTAPELMKLTRVKNVDPGWNMELVDKCIRWIDRESMALMGSNWPEIWAPEKLEERVKSDGGFYVGDQVPTIDCFDFYFYQDDDKDPGWRRRIILDSWSSPQAGLDRLVPKTAEIYASNRNQFLYTSKGHKFADGWNNIMAFQFADLSAVGPFRYHSVRSLGFLLYAVCHLQNRLRCRFSEAVFEALMMYFRVKTMDDAQRALKVDLINRGFIEEGIAPLTAQERYQVNTPLVQLGLEHNQRLITDNSSSYTQNSNYSQGGVEKTKFQVLAETNAMTSLVSAGLTQAYEYQKWEYREIVRRFMRRNSKDPDVREFQAYCLKHDVPDDLMNPAAWEAEPERVMGAGNKTLEMTIAGQLMEWRDKFDPEPQQKILRDAVLSITDDPARAEELVPRDPAKVTDSVHDAQLAAGTLMLGLPVGLKTGLNHIEYVETLLVSLSMVIRKAKVKGNMATPDELVGMQNLANHIAEHIGIIAQDENEKARVKKYGDQLGNLMNEMKGFAQRLDQQMKEQQQQGNGQMDPKDQAKIQASIMTAQAKAQNTRESHAQRTAQRQIQFEQKMKQDAETHSMEMVKEAQRIKLDAEAKDIETAANVRRNKLKSTSSE